MNSRDLCKDSSVGKFTAGMGNSTNTTEASVVVNKPINDPYNNSLYQNSRYPATNQVIFRFLVRAFVLGFSVKLLVWLYFNV